MHVRSAQVTALSAEDAEHRELFNRNVSCTKMGGMAGSVASVNGVCAVHGVVHDADVGLLAMQARVSTEPWSALGVW